MSFKRFIDSTSLHILAMFLMFLDHLWGILAIDAWWLTNLGRLAFPIFAFMLVEGFYHTGNLKKYFKRLLIGALISEIPYNLMMSGSLIDPFDQNVMWTFIIGLGAMYFTDKLSKKNKYFKVFGILIFYFASIIALITFVDYNQYGIMMIAVFYFFRGNKWYLILLQFIGLFTVNELIFKGMTVDINLFGYLLTYNQQSYAVFSLIPIWLYNGEKGFGKKGFQYFSYLFYPLHILFLITLAYCL
ncbi:MAG: TraX family protein [Erysipelotrichaceae bacterium]|nr:TraX family protein [Erysipelotrichaceae bacterium]